ncbi:NADPH-dependent FMN reductase [Cellulomonas sp. NPDC057328]|uniref:NADPH-dependent FMN reductase n=1 Tax=Cellulomonas sp. NPDC057328 TaxID=3346101 RepID=UPI00362E1EBE
MTTTVVVGNPRAASRTLDAAVLLATALTGNAPPPDDVLDVITIGPQLLTWGDPGVAAWVRRVSASDVVVVASPTYKGTYCGVLKLFLDHVAGGTGLRDVVAVPLMLGAGPAHALAPELTLRPVLTELGATTALPGLHLLDSTYRESTDLTDYAARWSPTVTALTAGAAR